MSLVPVWLAGAARTAVRPVDAELSGWNPVELAGVVGQEVLDRTGTDPSQVDEVIVGSAELVGANGSDAARAVVLAAGWPDRIGGHGIDRAETSGAMAVQAGAAAIASGQARAVLVIGLGLASVVPPGSGAMGRTYGAPWGGVAERLADRGGLLPPPRLAERAAAESGITRAELDAFAEESCRRRRDHDRCGSIVAVAARFSGTRPDIRWPTPVSADRVRDLGTVADLPPAFGDGGLLTAATFAPPADAVTALLLQASEPGSPRESGKPVEPRRQAEPVELGRSAKPEEPGRLGGPERLGEPETAAVVGTGRAAGDPFDPVGGVRAAVDQALASGGLKIDDMVAVAVTEPTAAAPILVGWALGIDPAEINPSGGALATGDAGAAEELRLIADGLVGLEPAQHLLTISAGPTGSVATVWRCR